MHQLFFSVHFNYFRKLVTDGIRTWRQLTAPVVVVVVGVQAGDAAPGDVQRRQVGGEEAVFVWK